jgi:hypothetical protein
VTTQCPKEKGKKGDDTMSKRKRVTTQCPKEKGQKDNDLQNATQKIKYRATRTPLKTRGELMCSGRVGSYQVCSNSMQLY